MADVRPFRGLRYNPRRVSVEKVVTQPYDKITREMRERYYAADPHNIVRVILGKGEDGDSPGSNVYTRAAAFLNEWRESGVIEPMHGPAFFACSQSFMIPGTAARRVRKGFIGLGRLEDYSNGIVYPHERTLAGPKEDRLQLLRHTRTHFEQIFMLYEDEKQAIDKLLDQAVRAAAPGIEVTDEYGVTHSLWPLNDPTVLHRIQEEMKGRKLIIADGHHRYETALAYRDEIRAQGDSRSDVPHEWLPMTFFNMSSPALTVLPTHRVVSRLRDFDGAAFLTCASEFFDLEGAHRDTFLFESVLAVAGRRRPAIGMVTRDLRPCFLLRLKDVDLSDVMGDLSETQRTLDVAILHRLLLERCLGLSEEAVQREHNITYVREFGKAMSAVSDGDAQVTFLLNPVGLDQLRKIVYEGNVMPQKSTDFYPKVLSGLVLFSLDDPL